MLLFGSNKMGPLYKWSYNLLNPVNGLTHGVVTPFCPLCRPNQFQSLTCRMCSFSGELCTLRGPNLFFFGDQKNIISTYSPNQKHHSDSPHRPWYFCIDTAPRNEGFFWVILNDLETKPVLFSEPGLVLIQSFFKGCNNNCWKAVTSNGSRPFVPPVVTIRPPKKNARWVSASKIKTHPLAL